MTAIDQSGEIPQFLAACRGRVAEIVEGSSVHPSYIIQRYTAAIEPNFTFWMACSAAFARHERAGSALVRNLRCELEDDHRKLLRTFAESCMATPAVIDQLRVAPSVSAINMLFRDTDNAGLRGTALCAILEVTSAVFIPSLERCGKERQCKDFEYIRVHGAADQEHADLLTLALAAEYGQGYEGRESQIIHVRDRVLDLVRAIWR